MGISLHNIAKKIEDVAGGVERQLNPFDNGATYSNPNPAPQPTAQAPAPAPAQNGPVPVHPNMPLPGSFFGPNPLNPQLAPTPVTTTQNSKPKHSAIPTPPLGIPTPTLQPGTMPAPGPLNLGGKTLTPNPLPTGPESSVNPLQAARGLAQGVARGIYEIPTSIAQGISGKPVVTQPSTASKFLFGDKPFQTIQEMGASTAQAHPGGFQVGPVHLTPKEAGAAETGLQLAQDVPLVGSVASKAAKVLTPVNDATKVALLRQAASQPKVAFKGAEAADAAKPSVKAVQAAETAAPTAKAATTPVIETPTPTKPTAPLTVSEGLPPKTAQAAQDLADLYNRPIHSTSDASQLINKNIGRSRTFSTYSDRLQAAMEEDYTPAERTTIRDNLEGAADPKTVTPKIQAGTDTLRQLNDMGYQVLDKTQETGIGRVRQYATRLSKSAVSPALSGVEKAKVQLKDLLNVSSGFGRERSIKKFVSSDGEVRYGTQSDAGLQTKDGQLTGGGKTWQPKAVSTKELQQAGFKYENDYGKIANRYHSSVGRVKAANDTVTELARDPESYGLTTEQAKGYESINGAKELAGYYAPKSVARDINRTISPRSITLGERAWQGLNTGVIQSIVFNPLIHGRNLNELAGLAISKAQGVTGLARRYKAYGEYAGMNKDERLNLWNRMDDSGVTKTSYGSNRSTVLTKAADKAGVPHVSKIGPTAMAHLDWDIRSSLFHALTTGDRAVGDDAAAKIINDFLGNTNHGGAIAQNIGLFWHYLTTRGHILKMVGTHPIENKGVLAGMATQAAVFYGTTKAFQDATGNKHASIGHPGMFGLVNEANNLRHGNTSSVVSQNINPIVQAAGNQIYGKDLYTKKDITHNRLGNAESTLFGPTQYTNKVASGKASPVQAGIQALTGINLPHAKDAPAVPNQNFPGNSYINTKGSKVAQGNDPTGYSQGVNHFTAVATAKKGLSADDQNTFDQLTASTSKMNDKQIQGHYQDLASHPGVLEAIAKSKQIESAKSGTPLDPLYSKDYTPEQRQAYLHMLSLPYKGDDYIQQQDTAGGKQAENGWMYQLTQARNDYFNKVDFADASKAERVKPPVFDDQTQASMDAASGLSGAEKAQFIIAHPEVQQAYDALAQYTNDKRVAQGNAPFKLYPGADPATQAVLSEYQALPKGGGSKGGNKYIAEWIQANPDKYAKIQNYYSNVSEYELANSAGQDKYQGATPSQEELKSAYSLGKYDISQTKNADGSKSYALDPAAAAAASSAYASSFKSGSSYNPNKQLARNAKAMAYHSGIPKIGAKIKRPSVKLSKSSTSVKFKGTPKLAKSSKVALKPSKV